AGRHIYIPRTREALTCWGYMQAMHDLSVLADEEGHRIMGACPPEQTTTLQLIQSFVRYARAHRTELQGNAVLAVFRALREAHPCRAEHGGSIGPEPKRPSGHRERHHPLVRQAGNAEADRAERKAAPTSPDHDWPLVG